MIYSIYLIQSNDQLFFLSTLRLRAVPLKFIIRDQFNLKYFRTKKRNIKKEHLKSNKFQRRERLGKLKPEKGFCLEGLGE